MRYLRPLLASSTICLLGGVAGGLALGYVLSKQAGWLTPVPWMLYLLLLLGVIAAASWTEERRRGSPAERHRPPSQPFSPTQAGVSADRGEPAATAGLAITPAELPPEPPAATPDVEARLDVRVQSDQPPIGSGAGGADDDEAMAAATRRRRRRRRRAAEQRSYGE